ncbi:MAG: ABC transporter substrate-binding protein [Candidatus Bathyarchaeia archaeon]
MRYVILACLAAGLLFPGFAQKVVIEYWDATTQASREWWRATMVETFNKLYPNIEVRLLVIPFAEYFTKLQAAFAAGTVPDVFAVDCPLVPRYAEVENVLLELDEYFKYEMDDFVEPSLIDATWKGHFYAVPYCQGGQAIYYNKQMFAELGLQPPTDPENAWTWEYVIEIAKRLTKDLDGDGTPDIWGIVLEQVDRPYQVNVLLESKGARVISPDGTTVRGYLNSPEAIEAATFYWKLFNEWKVAPRASLPELFGQGKAAMFWGGPAQIALWTTKYPDLEWGVMPLPYFEGGRKVSPCGAWHLGIYKNTPHVAEALQFVRFMTNEAAIDLNYLITNYLPVRRSTYQIFDIFNTYPIGVFAKQLFTTASPRPRTVAYLEYEEILRTAYRNIMSGADPATELNNAVVLIDRVLSRYMK